jgi:pimeloyl-ACP methyl ester carboxylesterase
MAAVLPVRESGRGVPLVLLHGLGTTGEEFVALSALLAEAFQVIVPDLRGHGESAHLPGPYSAEAMAADLAPTLDALGVASAHMLGHSHGGAAAQVFARTHPERVRSLVLVSTYTRQRLTLWERLTGRMAPPTVTALETRRLAMFVRWLRTAGGGRKFTPEAAAVRSATLAANDSGQLAAALHDARPFDSRGWLEMIHAPALVIAGRQDYVVVPRQAQLLAAGIPAAQLRMLDDGGHELPLSHPAELAHLITGWVRGRELAAST